MRENNVDIEKYVMILYERKVNVDGREVCHDIV